MGIFFFHFIVGDCTPTICSNGRQMPGAQARSDGQVKSRGSQQAPIADPNISRPPAVGGTASIFPSTTVLRSRWQKPGLLDVGVKAGRFGAGSKDGSEGVVSLGAITPARGMNAETIRHAIAQWARNLGRGHWKAKPKLHHDFEEGAINMEPECMRRRGMQSCSGSRQLQEFKVGTESPPLVKAPPAWQSRSCPAPLTTVVAEGSAALGWGHVHSLAAHG